MQTFAVIAAVVLAAGYLGLRLFRHLSGKRTGCGCEQCPATRTPAPPQGPGTSHSGA